MPRRAAGFVSLLTILMAAPQAAGASADAVIRVAPGYVHSCALTAAGDVHCWGMEQVNGRAENTTSAHRVDGLPRAAALASGHVNSCILDGDGAAWCWGVDLQASVEAKRAVVGGPRLVTGLPPAAMIASGHLHSCAVARADGAVWCWGANAAGELGDGSTSDRAQPVRAGDLTGVSAIAAGINNTCAIAAAGAVYCWGTDLQSGDGEIVHSHVPMRVPLDEPVSRIANGRNFICALTASHRVICFGSNILNQLGDRALGKTYTTGSPAGVTEAQDIGTGGFFGCALLQAGDITCWGHLPTANDATYEGVDPQRVAGLGAAQSLGIGITTACVIAADGRVLCWGNNQTGQVGNGRTADIEFQPVEVRGLGGGAAATPQASHAPLSAEGFADPRFLHALPVPAEGARAPVWWLVGKAQRRLGASGPR